MLICTYANQLWPDNFLNFENICQNNIHALRAVADTQGLIPKSNVMYENNGLFNGLVFP